MESPDENEDSDSEAMRQEMEIALYSQLHFEENTDYGTVEQPGNDGSFDIKVSGNSPKGFKATKTTSDLLLNRSIGQKDDSENEASTCSPKSQSKRERNKKLIDDILERMDADFNDDADAEFQDLDSDIDSLYGVLDDDLISDPGGIQLNIKRNHRPLLETCIVEDDKWKISFADIKQGKDIGRYHKRFRCHNCNEEGHLSKNCPKPKKEKVCSFCSETGHFMLKCPHSFCYNCDVAGHDARDCPSPRRNPYTTCFRCRMQGHEQTKCPDLWRQFHHTTSPGKIIAKKRKGRKVTFCYNCAGDDHYGHECEDDRMSRYVRVASPFVCRYDKRFGAYGNVDREGTEKEPPAKRQATESAVRKAKQVSSFIIGNNKSNCHTGRNNFDKLQFNTTNDNYNKKQTWDSRGKGKQSKDKDPKSNVPQTDQKRYGKVKKVLKQTEEIEDFPRGGKVYQNPNGFRSRFIEKGTTKSVTNVSDISITLNCKGDNRSSTVNRNYSNLRESDSIVAQVSQKKGKKRKHFELETFEDSAEFTNHQVHNNEWWDKKKPSSKSRRKKKRQNQM